MFSLAVLTVITTVFIVITRYCGESRVGKVEKEWLDMTGSRCMELSHRIPLICAIDVC
jgi:hypothetical protein